MVESNEFVVPIVVAVLTAFVTALITVTAKFAPTESEAKSGITAHILFLLVSVVALQTNQRSHLT
jgi:hypothetical protein